jgi:hypothetical protein
MPKLKVPTLKSLDVRNTRITPAGVELFQKAHPQVKVQFTIKEPVSINPPGKPDFIMTMPELAEDYDKDRAAARQKYDGKVVEVTGTVSNVGYMNPSAIGNLTFYSRQGITLQVKLRNEYHAKAYRLSMGQKIKVVATFAEAFGAMPIVDNGVLTELEPSTIIEISADDLAKKFRDDRFKAEEEFRNKTLLVTGPLQETRRDKNYGFVLTLKTSGEPVVKVNTWKEANAEVGEKVTLRTQSLVYDEAKKSLTLHGGTLLDACD